MSDRTAHGEAHRTRWPIVGLLATGHFANDFYALFLAALLPTLSDRFGLTGVGVALLTAVMSVTASVSQPWSGWLGERANRRAIIVIGLAGSAAFMSLLAGAPSLPAVVGLLVLGGLGVSTYHPNAGMAVRAAAGRRVGLALAVFISAGTMGVFAAPAFVSNCVAHDRLHLVPWSMVAGLGLAAVLAVAPLGDHARAAQPPRFRELFRRAHAPLFILLGVGVLRAFTYGTFQNFFLFHGRASRWSPQAAGLMLSGFLGFAAAGGLMGGLVSHRLGHKRIIVWSSLVGGLVLLAGPQGDAAAAAAAMVVGGLALGAATPVVVVTAQELSPSQPAAATGLMTGLAWGLAGLMMPAVGAIRDATTPAWALRAGAVAAVGAGFLALRLAETARRPEGGEDEV